MLTYTMDVDPRSQWLRTTPGEFALSQPFCCTEAGFFYARSGFTTARTHKDSYLLFYTSAGEGSVRQGSSDVRLTPGTALPMNCRTPQSYGTVSGQEAHLFRRGPGHRADGERGSGDGDSR